MSLEHSEADRVAALRGYSILDTPDDPDFDALVQQAAGRLNTPIALISLVDEHRQWFKARCGLPARETPRSVSFCAHAIVSDDILIVEDATKDVRFMNNPLVINDPSIRFYAGAVLKNARGHRLGTLCVIDSKPRHNVSEGEITFLNDLAGEVMRVLEAKHGSPKGSSAATAENKAEDNPSVRPNQA